MPFPTSPLTLPGSLCSAQSVGRMALLAAPGLKGVCVSVSDGAQTLIYSLALVQCFDVVDERAVRRPRAWTQISADVHFVTPPSLERASLTQTHLGRLAVKITAAV